MARVCGHPVGLLLQRLHQDLEVVVGESLDGVERRDVDGAHDTVVSVVGSLKIQKS